MPVVEAARIVSKHPPQIRTEALLELTQHGHGTRAKQAREVTILDQCDFRRSRSARVVAR
jgi:hypothetical protein